MSESYDPKNDIHVPEEGESSVVEEQNLDQPQSPRRTASAEFVVTAEVGSESSLRDAMDPANQSLADALRLSFRVLQIVILILIVAFFGSGIDTVPDKYSGVLTRWGKIVTYDGDKALGSGLKYSGWPYPVSEFIIFEAENRMVNVSSTFLPNSSVRGYTIQEHIEKARPTEEHKPGVDGQLLTSEGDIVHVAVMVIYRIDDPVTFVQNLSIEQADDIVRWATERATITAVAKMKLLDLMEITEEVRQQILLSTQLALNDIGVGIRITQVTLPEPPRAPYGIQNTFHELQETRVNSVSSITQAELDADHTRNERAGRRWRSIINLIDQYEIAEDLNDAEASATHLAAITEWLDNDAEGEASMIISEARRYQSQVDSTLGNEAKRFASLLQSYRQHPDLAIRQPWMNTIAHIMSRSDAEVFSVPASIGAMSISISGLDEIAQERRDLRLDRKNKAGWTDGLITGFRTIQQAEDMSIGTPGRQINIKDGKLVGQGTTRNN
ncbi:MAG: SPFH domain-containing protein [Planctomycetota bacterium]|nr:SPFH domain-containing protein [Planctomycetota bacterium]